MNVKKHWILIALAAACLALGLLAGPAVADNEQAAEMAKPAAEPTKEEAQQAETVTTQLDGAKVFAWNCGSCHSERYPKERSDAKWKIIVKHMRVRANLTADQADAVLDYLKGNN